MRLAAHTHDPVVNCVPLGRSRRQGKGLLLHYDYERDKSRYPEAHLHVRATSDAREEVTRRCGREGRPLERFHLPLGPRRLRPVLEDLIEFLIVEGLAPRRPGWEAHIRQGRARFMENQLAAAVRSDPEIALHILREEGLIPTT